MSGACASDSVEYIFWLVKDPMAKADNRHVLQPYSEDMKRLIKQGVKQTIRPSGHVITGSFANDQGGSIPPNPDSMRQQRVQ